MSSKQNGIGVVFNIDDLGGGFYGARAWEILMKYLQPSNLAACTFTEGDTNATLGGTAREFCIAIYGTVMNIEYVEKTFANLEQKGLAAERRRFIKKPLLNSEPLTGQYSVDAEGRFVEPNWSRVFHDLCKEAGWGYKPKSVPKDLPSDLRKELQDLMSMTTSSVAPESDASMKSSASIAQKQKSEKEKNWWEFWK